MSERVSNFPYKKKKRSFAQTLKKSYSRERNNWKGTYLEADLYEYFKRVLLRESEGFESSEEKRVFAENVIDQITGNEVAYSSIPLVCRVIETMLPFVSNGALMRFMEEFGKDLRPICGDKYCCRVLEQLISVAARRAMEDEIKVEDETTNFKEFCLNWIIKVSRFMVNNIEEFVWENTANYVIRTLMTKLSGVMSDEKRYRVQKVEIEKQYTPPEEFINMLREFASRVMSWPQFADLENNTLTSVFLQDLIKALQLVDKKFMMKIVKQFLNVHFMVDGNSVEVLPALFENNSGVHILETIIDVSGKILQTKIYNQFFCRRLFKLSQMKNTNFAVQKIIARCKDQALFETIASELLPHIEEILNSKHTGVIVNLCQACERFGTKQVDFKKALKKALGCSDSENNKDSFAICVLKLSTFSSDLKESSIIHLHGSLILQSLLRFKKPIKIVSSLLSVEPIFLASLLSDEKGSHVTDSFVSSPSIGQKSHDRLLTHLMGCYVTLATSKHGSRSFDALWNIASFRHKVQIAEELSTNMPLVTSNMYGIGVAKKVALTAFQHDKEEWKKHWTKTDNRRKLFSDIIGD